MSIKTVNFTAAGGSYQCDQPEDQSGPYVSAAQVEEILGSLTKLVWAVHYGSGFAASNAATEARMLMDKLAA